jgi:hypothetical protein
MISLSSHSRRIRSFSDLLGCNNPVVRSIWIVAYCLCLQVLMPSGLSGQSSTASDQTREKPESGGDRHGHPRVADRELLILKTGIEKVYGNYLIAVLHQGVKPEELSFALNLPKEMSDFQVGEGLEAKDVTSHDGKLVVKKMFNPGTNVIGVNFIVPIAGQGQLTFLPPRTIAETIVMTPQGMLQLSSSSLLDKGKDQQESEVYQVWSNKTPWEAGGTQVINIDGVVIGRQSLWYIGSLLLILLAFGSVMGVRSLRPSLRS